MTRGGGGTLSSPYECAGGQHVELIVHDEAVGTARQRQHQTLIKATCSNQSVGGKTLSSMPHKLSQTADDSSPLSLPCIRPDLSLTQQGARPLSLTPSLSHSLTVSLSLTLSLRPQLKTLSGWCKLGLGPPPECSTTTPPSMHHATAPPSPGGA
jgi:hypothetical protein